MQIPKKFPSTVDLLRIETEREYHNLYNCDFLNPFFKRTWFLLQEFFQNDEEKKKVLAVTMDITPAIVRAGTVFLFGKPVKIQVDDNSDSDGKIQKAIDAIVKRNNLQQKLIDSSKPFQYTGHTQFKLRADVVNNKKLAVIEEIPFDNWFPNFTNLPEGATPTVYHIVSYISELEADDMVRNRYIYIEEHTAGQISYALFNYVDGRIGGQVPFSTMPGLLPKRPDQATDALGTVTEKTGLTAPDVVQIDGERTVKDRLGQSLLKPIRPLLDEINTRVTQMSLQIFNTLDPILQAPKGSLPIDQNGNTQRKKRDVFLVENGDPDLKYVTNDNPMLEETFKYIELLIEKSAKLTHTPQSFLMPDDKGGIESAESLRTRFMLFLKQIEGYRLSYTDGIEKILRLALQIEGITVPDDLEFKITFDFGLPQDPEIEGKVWGQAVMDGIASVETAVSQFQSLEGDLLQEELKRIKADQALTQQMQPKPDNTPDPLELTAA